MKQTVEDNLLISARAFPYHYDPNNQTEAYLTPVNKKTETKESKTKLDNNNSITKKLIRHIK